MDLESPTQHPVVEDEVITPPRPTLPRWFLWAGPLGLAAMIAEAISSRSWFLIVYLPVWALCFGARWWLPTVRVSPSEIRFPARKKDNRVLSWADVESVNTPSRFDTTTSLRMKDGRTVELPGIAARRAPDVARVGGKPLQRQPASPARAPSPARPTEAQQEADLARRAEALAVRGRELSEQLRKLTS